MRARSEQAKETFRTLFKKGDIIVLILIVALVAASVVCAVGYSGGDTAVVYVDGEKVYSLPLGRDATVELSDGAVTVTVEDGRVRISRSDCPEQLCVHSAPIGAEGGAIVCLPMKVTVVVESGEVDAIT